MVFDGFIAFTNRLRAEWPPTFKIVNVDKYEPKVDPKSWLQIYSTAVRAGGGCRDILAAYLQIMLGESALTWLQNQPPNSIDT